MRISVAESELEMEETTPLPSAIANASKVESKESSESTDDSVRILISIPPRQSYNAGEQFTPLRLIPSQSSIAKQCSWSRVKAQVSQAVD